jgi:isopentenyldiphosphate isomerase
MATASQHLPIQIVDKNDKPIGGADMLEAYDKSLIHRIIYVFVVNPAGNVLLQKRSAMVTNSPNTWDISVGGHVDEGESYLEAAKRELQEELGLIGLDLQEIKSLYHEIDVHGRHLKRFNKIYKVEIVHNHPIKYEPFEITEIKWFNRRDIAKLLKHHPEQAASGLINFFEAL